MALIGASFTCKIASVTVVAAAVAAGAAVAGIRAGVAAVVDGDGQHDVAGAVADWGVGGVGGGDEGVDVGDVAGECDRAVAAPNGDSAAAGGGQRASGRVEETCTVPLAASTPGEADAGQCGGGVFCDGDGRRCCDGGGVVYSGYRKQYGFASRSWRHRFR